MYIRSVISGRKAYFYLVQSIRINGQSRQKVIEYLGDANTAFYKLITMDAPLNQKLDYLNMLEYWEIRAQLKIDSIPLKKRGRPRKF